MSRLFSLSLNPKLLSFFIQTLEEVFRKSEVEEGSGKRNGFWRKATEVKERGP